MQGCIKLTIVVIALFICSALFAQQKKSDTTLIPNKRSTTGVTTNEEGNLKVTGIITDAATGKPLAAVNVSVPEFAEA